MPLTKQIRQIDLHLKMNLDDINKFSKYKPRFQYTLPGSKTISTYDSQDKSVLRNIKSFSALLFYSCITYSSSIVPGGLLVISYSTRLTPLTSLTILFITLPSTSQGSSAASAVMKSDVVTARKATA